MGIRRSQFASERVTPYRTYRLTAMWPDLPCVPRTLRKSPGFTSMRFLFFLVLSGSLLAQTTPEALGSLVLERFRAGTSEAFAAIYPFPEGRAMRAEAERRKMARVDGLARVIGQRDTEAVLLLSAHGRTLN